MGGHLKIFTGPMCWVRKMSLPVVGKGWIDWYTPAPPVWCLMAMIWKGWTSLYPIPHISCPYPATKAMAERQSWMQYLPILVLLSSDPISYGAWRQSSIARHCLRAKNLRRIGNGTNVVDTIYVDNAAHAHVLAGDRLKVDASLSGNIYFISQDDPIPLWQMVDYFLEAARLPPVQGVVSARGAYWVGGLFELLFKIFPLKGEPPMTRFAARELATSHWFDISRAKQDLGYVPLVSTDEGLNA